MKSAFQNKLVRAIGIVQMLSLLLWGSLAIFEYKKLKTLQGEKDVGEESPHTTTTVPPSSDEDGPDYDGAFTREVVPVIWIWMVSIVVYTVSPYVLYYSTLSSVSPRKQRTSAILCLLSTILLLTFNVLSLITQKDNLNTMLQSIGLVYNAFCILILVTYVRELSQTEDTGGK